MKLWIVTTVYIHSDEPFCGRKSIETKVSAIPEQVLTMITDRVEENREYGLYLGEDDYNAVQKLSVESIENMDVNLMDRYEFLNLSEEDMEYGEFDYDKLDEYRKEYMRIEVKEV